MNILLLNGAATPDDSRFGEYLSKLKKTMGTKHTVQVMNLTELKISRCTGCFGCWVKTPGKCVSKDDSHRICEAYIRADLVVFASPIIRGFTSALLKRAQDKLIPLLHPYFVSIEGEVHHMARYDAYPQIGLLIERREDTDDEDIEIVTDIYHRIARNFHTTFTCTASTHMDAEEAARVIVAH